MKKDSEYVLILNTQATKQPWAAFIVECAILVAHSMNEFQENLISEKITNILESTYPKLLTLTEITTEEEISENKLSEDRKLSSFCLEYAREVFETYANYHEELPKLYFWHKSTENCALLAALGNLNETLKGDWESSGAVLRSPLEYLPD